MKVPHLRSGVKRFPLDQNSGKGGRNTQNKVGEPGLLPPPKATNRNNLTPSVLPYRRKPEEDKSGNAKGTPGRCQGVDCASTETVSGSGNNKIPRLLFCQTCDKQNCVEKEQELADSERQLRPTSTQRLGTNHEPARTFLE